MYIWLLFMFAFIVVCAWRRGRGDGDQRGILEITKIGLSIPYLC